jgi:hypothetical protein
MNTPPERGTVKIDGEPRPALIFPLTLDGIRRKRLSQAIWLVPLLAFSLIYVFLLIRIGTRTDATSHILRIFVMAMEGVFIAIAVWMIRAWRKPGFVALLREGVYSRSGIGPVLVPWETITKAGMHKLAGVLSLGLCTNATPRHGPFWMGANRPLQRRLTGWDFSYPLAVIRGSAEFERIVHSCLADPAQRSRIAGM